MNNLDIISFIKQFYPLYDIDTDNKSLIIKLGLYANRDTAFEDPNLGHYLDKGILISGPVGTGKTKLLKVIFRNYLSYLRSPYGFRSENVWRYTEDFNKKGYSAFHNEYKDNVLYDELCLLDTKGEPSREVGVFYTTRRLIGQEIISFRYELFENTALQTHFTTNADFAELQRHYGPREYSRLQMMCNFFSLLGEDRRPGARPTFAVNYNAPQAPRPSELMVDEIHEIRKALERKYQLYRESRTLDDMAGFDFNALVYNGCDLGSEDELRALMDTVKMHRMDEIKDPMPGQPVAYEKRRRELNANYAKKVIDREEHSYLWGKTKQKAVEMFYVHLRETGVDTLPFLPLAVIRDRDNPNPTQSHTHKPKE